jgi:hypothetical protein
MFNLTRKVLRFLPISLVVISFFPSFKVQASDSYIITEPTDFFFSYSEPTHFLARTYQSDTFPSDPQLWLYNVDTGELLFTNDDFYGLQSNIEMDIGAGNYRLRASTCCYQPDVWRSDPSGVWNIQYELSFNGLQNSTTTTIGGPIEETTTTDVATTSTTSTTASTTIPDSTTSSSTTVQTTEPEIDTTTSTTTETPTTSTTEVPTTLTTETPTTSTTEAPFIEPETTVEPPETTFITTTEPEQVSVPEEEITTPETIIEPPVDIPVDTIVDEPTDNKDLINNITDENLTAEEIASVVDEALGDAESEEELLSIASDLLNSDLNAEQFDSVIKSIFSQPLSDEGFEELVNQVFDEELSDEEFTSAISAILDSALSEQAFNSLIDVLGGDTVTDDQVQEAVDSIIDNGIDETQALSISTSAEVLSSITGDQASEIFAEVSVGDLTDEQGEAIVNAVQDSPEEVRSSFEAEINVFDGAFDNYAPIGSEISVAQRRIVVAAGAVLASAMPLPQSGKAESRNGRRVK